MVLYDAGKLADLKESEVYTTGVSKLELIGI